MKQILVNQFICFEFPDECLNADGTSLIKSKLKIHPVICYRAIHYVIVVGEVFVGSVCHNKLSPLFCWFRKQQTIEIIQAFFIKIIHINVATCGMCFHHTSFYPILSLLCRGCGIETFAVVECATWCKYLRMLHLD